MQLTKNFFETATKENLQTAKENPSTVENLC